MQNVGQLRKHIEHLARLGIEGKTEDVVLYTRRLLRRLDSSEGPLVKALKDMLPAPEPGSFLRGNTRQQKESERCEENG